MCDLATQIPDMISNRAAETPNATAISDGEQLLTYRDLDARTTELAEHLRQLGVQAEVLVGICLKRSVAMIVGALAVLKAGGAYLPLDSGYPSARLSFLLNDARIAVLLTTQESCNLLPLGDWRVVELDAAGNAAGVQPVSQGARRRIPEIKPYELAYVIYTSGSAGQPKGVEITNASVLNLITWHQKAFAVSSADRATQLANIGFDAAVWEIWPYLTAGASLHLPDENTCRHAEKLRDWLVDQRITHTFAPTPIAEQLIHLDWPSNTSLRFLLTGADTLHHFPPTRRPFVLVNNYGPTECTVVATSGQVLSDYRPDPLPPIGRPIANAEIYILDENLNRVSVGTPGEIYIGGAGLARGYRNRCDLTAERFIPNPFSTQENTRLYRTGDMARYLSDGQIAFLGRVDDQVKIRGYRIEPNEIVTVLNQHPAISSSFVMPRVTDSGDKQLVAYIVLKSDVKVNDSDLRSYLSTQLPDYMLPAIFVELNSLPITSRGKVDRDALPAPTDANIVRDERYVAPRTPVEERIAGILSSLLHLEQVGMNDNFFFLGGDSLLGAKLAARVRDAFGIELTLLTLFDHPTVGELSTEIEHLLLDKLDAMSEEEAERLASGLNWGECA